MVARQQQLDLIRLPKWEDILGPVHLRSSEVAAKTKARAKAQERDFESISIIAEAKELSEEGCWGVRL